MRRLIFTLLGVFLIAIVLSWFNFEFSHQTISSLYNVLGIIFSIGMGLLITFRLDGIKNTSYVRDIRANVGYIRNCFIIYFAISTVIYMFYQKVPAYSYKSYIDTSLIANQFTTYFLAFSMIYFVVNFLAIQKLNEDIFDRINKELQNKK